MKRLNYLDYLKGFIMFLVVYRHCIQYLSEEAGSNILFQELNAFNMPVFMVVSGFLFYRKLSEGRIIDIAKRQFKRLIIPCCTWGIISLSLDYVVFSNWGGVNRLLGIPFHYWFLSSLFLCSLIYLLSNRCLGRIVNYYWQIVLLSALTILVSPSEYLTYFMPFFGIGIILRRHNVLSRSPKHTWPLFLLIIALLAIWDHKYSINSIGNPSLHNFEAERFIAYLMRIVVGGGIAVALLFLFKRYESRIPLKGFWQTVSHNSLVIYVAHMTILPIIQCRLALSEWQIDAVMLGVALILVVGIGYFTALCRKNKIVSLILFGEDS